MTAFTVTINTVLVNPTLAPLLDAIRAATGREDIDWARQPEPLTGGFWAEMWRVRITGSPELAGDLVARVMPVADVARRETRVQRRLAEDGFPTPMVRLSAGPGPHLDRAWMLMEHASGQTLLADLSGPGALLRLPQLVRSLPDTLADCAAALHGIPPDVVDPELAPCDDTERILARLHGDAAARDDRDLVTLAESLTGSRPAARRLAICHGDLHPFNILARPGAHTVLDWSSTQIADPTYDLAFTHLLLAQPPLAAPAPLRPIIDTAGRGIARRFLKSYERRTGHPVDTARLRWFTRLQSLRILGEVASWSHDDTIDTHRDHPFLALAPALRRIMTADAGSRSPA